MNCNEVREMLSLYIDQMLDENQMKEIEKHLLTCGSCKDELDSLILISGILKDLPEVELPGEFDARLKEKLLQTNKVIKKKKWIRYSSFAAIFLVGIFTIAMYNDMNADLTRQAEDANSGLTMMKAAEAPETLKNREMVCPEQRPLKAAAYETELVTEPDNLSDLNKISDISELTRVTEVQEPSMLMKSQPLDEAMINYVKMLDELYKDQKYNLLDWNLESPGIYIINIELETSSETGTVSTEVLSYRGQDGELCKTE